MTTEALVIPVGGLVGKPGTERQFSGEVPVRLRLGETRVSGTMTITGVARGLTDAVKADFTATALADMACVRCTVRWDHEIAVSAEQYFSLVPDEDGYAIVEGSIDVGPPAIDELALGLVSAPLCRDDCKGLCPTCGNDLNTDPCDGHGEDSASPFSVLKDLFDS